VVKLIQIILKNSTCPGNVITRAVGRGRHVYFPFRKDVNRQGHWLQFIVFIYKIAGSLKALLHDAIFLATCIAILRVFMNSLQIKQSSLIYMSQNQINCVASCKKNCIVYQGLNIKSFLLPRFSAS
jgi:hypothetical protein